MHYYTNFAYKIYFNIKRVQFWFALYHKHEWKQSSLLCLDIIDTHVA